ncbi:cadherin repeat domain-containing protein [Aquimarina algiphila]|uniref:cadherin repeat domain-containing protein n=1 Tax=Aquimarina algiphila TaxID=2047982 RepID=UPI002331303E|nr:cadherin repeat domain-containing protein [Aquimarina algiphila]
MKILKKTIVFFGVLLILIGCNKDDDSTPTVQNIAPTLQNQNFTVTEDIDGDTIIGTVIVTDPDNDALTYSITDNDLFTINNIGELRLAAGKTLNYDVAQTYAIAIEVSDGAIAREAIITINVTDITDVYTTIIEDGKGKIIKNGEVILSTESTGRFNSIYVSGKDVYTIGYKYEEGTGVVAYVWKNGDPTSISYNGNFADPKYISVSGDDVYVVGEVSDPTVNHRILTLWKNGTIIETIANGSLRGGVTGLYVFGSNVYVTFWERDSNGIDTVKLWKNGNITTLSNGITSTSVSGIYGLENNVYIVFNEKNTSNPNEIFNEVKLWHNGNTTTIMGDFFNPLYARDIYVAENNDIYIVGTRRQSDNNYAALWKNGTTKDILYNGTLATNIYIFKEDVYVGGYNNYPNQKARLWKNKETIILPVDDSNISYVTDVFVK